MKTQIDNLVRGIHHDLAQLSPAVPELAAQQPPHLINWCIRLLKMTDREKR